MPMTGASYVGWLLRANRTQSPDASLRSGRTFAAAFRPGLAPSHITRWETGGLLASRATVRRYEQLLGLPAESLVTVRDALYRTLPATRRPSPVVAAPLDTRLHELLEAATSTSPLTGHEWGELTELIESRPGLVLHPPGLWPTVAGKLLDELTRHEGTAWLQRQEAASRLLEHPTAGPHMVRACVDLIDDPSSPAVVEPLALMDVVADPVGNAYVLNQLESPDSDRHHRGALLAVVRKIEDGHFEGDQWARLCRAIDATPPGGDTGRLAASARAALTRRFLNPAAAPASSLSAADRPTSPSGPAGSSLDPPGSGADASSVTAAGVGASDVGPGSGGAGVGGAGDGRAGDGRAGDGRGGDGRGGVSGAGVGRPGSGAVGGGASGSGVPGVGASGTGAVGFGTAGSGTVGVGLDDPILGALVGQALGPSVHERLIAAMTIAQSPHRDAVSSALLTEAKRDLSGRGGSNASTHLHALTLLGTDIHRPLLFDLLSEGGHDDQVRQAAAWATAHCPGRFTDQQWRRILHRQATTWQEHPIPLNGSVLHGIAYGIGTDHHQPLLAEIAADPRLPAAARTTATWLRT
jgi:hypothetical protein